MRTISDEDAGGRPISFKNRFSFKNMETAA
jgi:hypothetical protein